MNKKYLTSLLLEPRLSYLDNLSVTMVFFCTVITNRDQVLANGIVGFLKPTNEIF